MVSEFANGSKCFKMNNSSRCGRVAQLGEHLLCKQGVAGSNPVTSTKIPRVTYVSGRSKQIDVIGEMASPESQVLPLFYLLRIDKRGPNPETVNSR